MASSYDKDAVDTSASDGQSELDQAQINFQRLYDWLSGGSPDGDMDSANPALDEGLGDGDRTLVARYISPTRNTGSKGTQWQDRPQAGVADKNIVDGTLFYARNLGILWSWNSGDSKWEAVASTGFGGSDSLGSPFTPSEGSWNKITQGDLSFDIVDGCKILVSYSISLEVPAPVSDGDASYDFDLRLRDTDNGTTLDGPRWDRFDLVTGAEIREGFPSLSGDFIYTVSGLGGDSATTRALTVEIKPHTGNSATVDIGTPTYFSARLLPSAHDE